MTIPQGAANLNLSNVIVGTLLIIYFDRDALLHPRSTISPVYNDGFLFIFQVPSGGGTIYIAVD